MICSFPEKSDSLVKESVKKSLKKLWKIGSQNIVIVKEQSWKFLANNVASVRKGLSAVN